jgi:hypothetical protein
MVYTNIKKNKVMRRKKRRKWKMRWNMMKTTLKFSPITIQYEIANLILETYLEVDQTNKASKVITRVLMTSSSR